MKTSVFVNATDEQLIQEYLKGNTQSLGELYKRYYPKVYQKCLSFSKNTDDAFDLTQDILMKAFSKVSSFKGNSRFSTWLYSISHNYCITSVAKVKNLHFDDIIFEQNIQDDSPDAEEMEARAKYEDKELQLKGVLELVPNLDKELLDLRYTQNYCVKELQSKYNLSASAVKMRLMRARQKVEQCFYQTAI